MIQKTEPSWATVNTDDPQEMAEFNEQEDRKAGERVKEAFQRLRNLGIVNESANSLAMNCRRTCILERNAILAANAPENGRYCRSSRQRKISRIPG